VQPHGDHRSGRDPAGGGAAARHRRAAGRIWRGSSIVRSCPRSSGARGHLHQAAGGAHRGARLRRTRSPGAASSRSSRTWRTSTSASWVGTTAAPESRAVDGCAMSGLGEVFRFEVDAGDGGALRRCRHARRADGHAPARVHHADSQGSVPGRALSGCAAGERGAAARRAAGADARLAAMPYMDPQMFGPFRARRIRAGVPALPAAQPAARPARSSSRSRR
jgi:hypothetical protein